jgi:hypothetical protein
VASVTSFLVIPDNRRSSTYCNKPIWGGRANSSSTHSKIWLNKLGKSVKYCVHQYYCFLAVWGSSHSKAKMSLLSSARGRPRMHLLNLPWNLWAQELVKLISNRIWLL